MYLLFLPSLLAIVVMLVISMRDTFTANHQPTTEETAQLTAPVMATTAETQA